MQAALLVGAVGATAYALWPNAKQPSVPYQADKPEELPQYEDGQRHWSVDPLQGVPIHYAKEGFASKDFGTVPQIFKACVEKHGNDAALMIEKPGYPADAAGEWQTITWSEYYGMCNDFAKSLIAIGHQPAESVAVCGFNSPEWLVAHSGATFACGLSAGTYPTNSADACQYVAADSNAVVVCVDTVANLNKYLSVKDQLPKVRVLVCWREEIPADIKEKHGSFVMSFSEFLKLGSTIPDADVAKRQAMQQPNQCVSLIYTSGTTGNPKGVMISHDNVLFSGTAAIQSLKNDLTQWHMLSYLPMSHIAAQILDIYLPLYAAGNSVGGKNSNFNVTVWFARPDAMRGSLAVSLKAVRPTTFFGVPRVWEKFAEGIKAKARAAPPSGVKLKLVSWAKETGLTCSKNRQVGGDGTIPKGISVADKVVYSKVRAALGFDRCTQYLTGAAPISRETLEFLASLGIDIHEVYGMSETTGMGTMSNADRFLFGSCGFRTKACELVLKPYEGGKPGEGEICFRGRHVMMGYLRNEQKTRETIDSEGFLHSGDVGKFDANGMLHITGRIKELIITAGGENIAPVPIESEIKRLLPAVSNVVMIGDKRKYNVMLVTPKLKPNLATGEFYDDLLGEAVDVNPAINTGTQASTDAKWREYVQAGLDKYNKSAFCPSNAQKIQKFVILPNELSMPGGELTPTLKLKRSFVENKYATQIATMYA